jgi:hypothetical protein
MHATEIAWLKSQSTYTGVYARGGPCATDASTDLSSYLDRTDTDVRGVKRAGAPEGSGAAQTPTSASLSRRRATAKAGAQQPHRQGRAQKRPHRRIDPARRPLFVA